ncbi:MAG: FAD-dependent oxidoreductase [Thermoleophilaceae bacterium]
MKDAGTFVIVGAGLAGATAAATLREEGFTGRVVLIGAESERPYNRPPLSKDYLRGESPREKLYVHSEGFYADQEIELRTTSAVAELRPQASEITLGDGESLRFDRLLLATGARPRRLDIPGADLDGVHYLRAVEDSDAIRAGLSETGRLVVIGAGWIGAEVAASARLKGSEVVMIAPEQVPLERVLGPEVGAIYGDIHAVHGVELLLGTGVESCEGQGSVERVTTSDGRMVDCDAVVIGAGVQPRVEIARGAGIDTADGIVVDAQLESSRPGVFAAGDVANHRHPFYDTGLRVEHWANALNQGPVAARNMLGRGEPYARVPYFFSDQYDIGMEYSGLARTWDRVVFRGDVEGREFIAFWLKDGRVVAGMNVNVWDVADSIQALIRSREQADVSLLADADVPLSEIGARAAEG